MAKKLDKFLNARIALMGALIADGPQTTATLADAVGLPTARVSSFMSQMATWGWCKTKGPRTKEGRTWVARRKKPVTMDDVLVRWGKFATKPAASEPGVKVRTKTKVKYAPVTLDEVDRFAHALIKFKSESGASVIKLEVIL